MRILIERILEVLKKNGPLKARKIALILDPTRRFITHTEVNSSLYKALGTRGLSKSDDGIWTYIEEDLIKIHFQCYGSWLQASDIEDTLKKYPNLLSSKINVEFDFSNKSLILDCILKILSLIHQLIMFDSKVTLRFKEGSSGFTYLQRCGFFDCLDENVIVIPPIPTESLSMVHHGNSGNLFEIFAINKDYRQSFLTHMMNIIQERMSGEHSKRLLINITTLISELVDNVNQHGFSAIDGYVALQVYKGNKIVISVSDSGSGLIKSLREEALPRYPDLERLNENSRINDSKLIGYVLSKGGISRKNEQGRGLGLYASNGALQKISNHDKTTVQLAIRQDNYEFIYPFNLNNISIDNCIIQENLTYIRGTHYVITINIA